MTTLRKRTRYFRVPIGTAVIPFYYEEVPQHQGHGGNNWIIPIEWQGRTAKITTKDWEFIESDFLPYNYGDGATWYYVSLQLRDPDGYNGFAVKMKDVRAIKRWNGKWIEEVK